MKLHVPVVCEVEADSMEAAELLAYRLLGEQPKHDDVRLVLAQHGMTARNGQRVFLLHPADSHADADPAAYCDERESRSDSETEEG